MQILIDVGNWVERKQLYPEMLQEVPAVMNDGELADDARAMVKVAVQRYKSILASAHSSFDEQVAAVLAGCLDKTRPEMAALVSKMKTRDDGEPVSPEVVVAVAHNMVVEKNMAGVPVERIVFTHAKMVSVLEVCM